MSAVFLLFLYSLKSLLWVCLITVEVRKIEICPVGNYYVLIPYWSES